MTEGEDKKVVSLPLPEIWGKNETSGSEVWRQKQAKRARRHSRFVIFLRIILPSFAAVLIGLVILWPQLKAQKEGFSFVDMDFEKISFPENQLMEKPRLYVVDNKNRPLNVTAETAQEVAADVGRKVRFNGLKADVLLENDVWMALDSETALYSQEENQLELQKKVNVYSDQGYELETTHAFVDIDSKNIVGDEKTAGQGPLGNIMSDGFAVYDGGSRLAFTGNVRLIFYPEKEK